MELFTDIIIDLAAGIGDGQAWTKVDFLVTKTDQTIFWDFCSDQTNTNIQNGKLTISNNNN